MSYVIICRRDFVCLLKEAFYSESFRTPLEIVWDSGAWRQRLYPWFDSVSGWTQLSGKGGLALPPQSQEGPHWPASRTAPRPAATSGRPQTSPALILQLFPNPKHDSRPRPTCGISENESRGIRLCFGEAPQLPPLGAAGKRSWEHRHHIPPG